MRQLKKALIVLTGFVLAACSPSSSGNGGGNNNPPAGKNPSKLENVKTITTEDFLSAVSLASKAVCPQGPQVGDKDMNQGMVISKWTSSDSSVRHQTSQTTETLATLSPTKIVWQTKLIAGTLSDFSGNLPISNLVSTNTSTKVTENGESRWNYRTDVERENMDPELLNYLINRKPDVDEFDQKCQVKTHAREDAPDIYSQLDFTLSSGKTVMALETDSKMVMTVECPGQPLLSFNIETQFIASPEVVGQSAEICTPLTQLRRTTVTKDLNGTVLKTDVEEILDSNLRKVN